MTLVEGHEVNNAPYELVLLQLLRELPGYTRETLEAEPAYLVERWRQVLLLEARRSKRESQQRK